MARGWSRSCQKRTFRDVPLRLATSMRLVSESVQYSFLPTQYLSQAIGRHQAGDDPRSAGGARLVQGRSA